MRVKNVNQSIACGDINHYYFLLFVVSGDNLVCAGVTSGVVSSGNPFPFPTVIARSGNNWNPTTSVLTVLESSGLYFVGLSIASSTDCIYTMHVSQTAEAGITRTRRPAVDMIGRDAIIQLYAGDTLHVSLDGEAWGSRGNLQTSITAFSISASMSNPTVAFSVARVDTVSGSLNPFPFDQVIYNNGFHYNMFQHSFIAPSSGVYYFSFSIGTEESATADFALYKNDDIFAKITRQATNLRSLDTIGRSVMMTLVEGDEIHIGNAAGQTARSTALKETSFSGFKYDPSHRNQVSLYKIFACVHFIPICILFSFFFYCY